MIEPVGAGVPDRPFPSPQKEKRPSKRMISLCVGTINLTALFSLKNMATAIFEYAERDYEKLHLKRRPPVLFAISGIWCASAIFEDAERDYIAHNLKRRPLTGPPPWLQGRTDRRL